MFTLTVSMIVKNEEATLSRILSVAKTFADEIIVIDTGSTDETVKIALGYTDKVFYYSWRDDFASARNYSFSFASCDYVMWLDADDYITPQNVRKIKNLKKCGDADMYLCAYKTAFDESGKCVFEFLRERIIKRSFAKWEGFIHEAIPVCGRVVRTDVAVEHRKAAVGDKRRNLKIYRKHERNGETFSARDRYYYARELYYNGYYLSALKKLDRIIDEGKLNAADQREAIILFAECSNIVGKPKKALYKLINGLSFVKESAKYLSFIGETLKRTGRYGAAIVFYERALTCAYDDIGFYESEYSDIIPYLELCDLYYRLKNVEKSFEYHQKAKACNEKNASVVYNEAFFKRANISLGSFRK